jgi:hypothetical protein
MLPCVAVSTNEFTSSDPHAWDHRESLGPVWLEMVGDRLTADRPINIGMTRFLHTIEKMSVGMGLTVGTAYGIMLDGSEVRPGRLHYDAGFRDPGPRGEVIRYVGTWSSDNANLNNAFLRRRRYDLEELYVGRFLNELNGNFIQAPNRHVTVFSEGLDLHARLPLPERPGTWGVLLSAALYRADQEVDLFCPRYEELRYRIPDGVKVLSTQIREDYESA